MRPTLLSVVAVAVAVLGLADSAQADPPPPGSTWSQATITEPDGTRLHADVLRPSNLPADAKTPVIVSVGPYFNHSGQTGPAGPIEGTPYDPTGPAGPSSRFYDFVNGAHLMQRGYTYVMVDLRGFGGSSGCLDWGGPGEQSDVKTAVEWAATQPWSTGHVGMYGKSYDGVTGLMGVALKPAGLDAVVSQEPVYDMYRYLYSNRVRFSNSFLTPALYTAIDATPGSIQDDPGYNVNGADNTARPGCYAANYLDQQSDDHSSAYWKSRDLIAKAQGSTIPLFMTQGFIENNTKPDGAYDFFNGVAGPKRAWFGMWDHVRGNDVDADGRLAMGRHGWFDEVMRFYDQHLLDAGGAANYSLNAGGDIRLRGRPLPGEPRWRVGIQHPEALDKIAAVVEANDLAIATSGTYRRGEHVVDPHSGRAPVGVLSVTITGPELATADAYATAAFAMGEAGPEWTASLGLYEAMTILADGRMLLTPGFPSVKDP
jgi:uncharacterized protein